GNSYRHRTAGRAGGERHARGGSSGGLSGSPKSMSKRLRCAPRPLKKAMGRRFPNLFPMNISPLHFFSFTLTLSLPALQAAPTIDPMVERGYRQMYDLNFDEAHRTFAQWEREHPADPLGPASNAAAYLFAEFDRLNILKSEFFVEDGLFRKRPKVAADP